MKFEQLETVKINFKAYDRMVTKIGNSEDVAHC